MRYIHFPLKEEDIQFGKIDALPIGHTAFYIKIDSWILALKALQILWQ